MKRVIVKNLSNQITHQADMVDPTAWIAERVAANTWGFPQRTKWKDECTSSELDLVISEQDVTIFPATPEQLEVKERRYLLRSNPLPLWKWESEITPEEKAASIQNEIAIKLPYAPAKPAVIKKRATLKATYSYTVTDVTAEYTQKANAKWVAQRSAQCDEDVNALLSPMEDVTHLMIAIYEMYKATNISGDQTPQEIAEAKTQLTNYLTLLENIQTLRAVRDQDIADYLASHT